MTSHGQMTFMAMMPSLVQSITQLVWQVMRMDIKQINRLFVLFLFFFGSHMTFSSWGHEEFATSDLVRVIEAKDGRETYRPAVNRLLWG